MTNQIPESQLQTQRHIEDRAIQLGAERREIQERMTANASAIRDLANEASAAGVALSPLARLLGVSRQMLYQGNAKGRRI